jgi:dihydropteroate synthase
MGIRCQIGRHVPAGGAGKEFRLNPIDSPTHATWAGFDLARPLVMGIVNATPDSFSDGGRSFRSADAIAHALTLVQSGADIIDIGGESTRPGAPDVSPSEEQDRILPVIQALAAEGIAISADTRNAGTMRAALSAGARIINDISGLTYDPGAASVAAAAGCPVVLMHMRGSPATMNAHATYIDVVEDVRRELAGLTAKALSAGIRPDRIVLDPGIGFAKLAPQSVALLHHLRRFASLGYPLLIGVSRKSFIGRLTDQPDPMQRLGGSIAAALFAAANGAAILRVHDVAETVQALRVWRSLAEPSTVPFSSAGS